MGVVGGKAGSRSRADAKKGMEPRGNTTGRRHNKGNDVIVSGERGNRMTAPKRAKALPKDYLRGIRKAPARGTHEVGRNPITTEEVEKKLPF